MKLVAVDGGADGGWGQLASLCDLTVHAFDPGAGPEGRDLRLLGERDGSAVLRLNRTASGSSVYPLNRTLTDRWRWGTPREGNVGLARDVLVEVGEEVCDTVALDSWAEERGIERVDVVKLNVQGSEIDVLRGAERLLPGMLALILEVAFVESYAGRPLFGDVDKFVRYRGFEFFDLLSLHHIGRAASPVFHGELAPGAPRGQLIEAHALYLRDLTWPGLTDERRPRLAVVAEAFGQLEYARELLA